jgi:eukaryotic-like serine/threonine-protein kinase
MPLVSGTKLGSFEVVGPLGAGGMGEVYRASDTKLKREVALKVLPELFTGDAQRMARFEREAQVLAALNHANIAAIFGLEESDGSRALVMELVEGPTLAERIALPHTGAEKGRPVPLDEALLIAKQIAEALEYAHERGIIHRDLKPANIKVKPDGAVKVLDFGLAKALADDPASGDISTSPTLSIAATQAGVILGTAAYMSPEQAKGKSADRRADIWAFGCVFFEMLTGEQPFEGETVSETLAAVIKDEPPWTKLPGETPVGIQKLIRRCLMKDPKHRLQAIGEARITIEEILSGTSDAPALSPLLSEQGRRETQDIAPWRRALPWAVAAVLGIALVGLLVASWRSRRPLSPLEVLRLVINDTSSLTSQPAISPDGRIIAGVLEPDSGGDDAGKLYVRTLDQFTGTPLRNTQGAANPFFSPDGSWIGYSSPQGLMKVPVKGGTPQLICPAASGAEAVWGPGNTIVFWGAESNGSLWPGLMRVSALGGAPEVLTSADASQGEFRDGWPTILPDGDTVLFTANTKGGTRIDAVSLRTRQRRIVRAGGAYARYDPSGYLLFWVPPSINLLAAPFDAKRLEFTGAPASVIEGVFMTATRSMLFALASNGTLIYLPEYRDNLEFKVMWANRAGQFTPVLDAPGFWVQPRLSPDGERILLRKLATNCELWIYDLQRRVLTRLAYENDNHDPLWMPDGKGVVFDVPNGSVRGLVWQAADGSGNLKPLTHGLQSFVPSSWSGDGRRLALTLSDKNVSQIWVLDRDGAPEPQPFHQNGFDEKSASFSPDGRYLAYSSDQSGRFEIYITAYPGPGAVTQVSPDGGTNPLWSRDGRELFYQNKMKMMAVKVATQPGLSVGVAQELFRTDINPAYRRVFGREYDVTPDGKRFVMLAPVGPTVSPPQIHVIVHFSEELKRLVSAGGI